MSTVNLGTQTINWKYKTSLKGSNLSRMFNGSTNPGIYLNNGVSITPGTGLVTSFTGNEITINAFTAIFKASTTQTVHVSTSSAINLSSEGSLGYITSAAPYITMSYTWADQIINYVDFSFKALSSLTSYDIVIGKAVFSGSNVISIDYSDASYPPLYNPTTQTLNVFKDIYAGGTIRANNIIVPSDGWTTIESTLTYASSTTFTMKGDLTGQYCIGDKFKIVQTISKYFALFNISYSSGTGLTTFTVIGNPTYPVANGPITAAYYSKQENPVGYPHVFDYVPTLTGWSSAPTDTIYRWSLKGTLLSVFIRQATAGTSNATTMTITAPYTSKNIANMSWIGCAWCQDNGVFVPNSNCNIVANSSTIKFTREDGTNWTSSGNKRVSNANLTYEIGLI